jgi:hypothetical protein
MNSVANVVAKVLTATTAERCCIQQCSNDIIAAELKLLLHATVVNNMMMIANRLSMRRCQGGKKTYRSAKSLLTCQRMPSCTLNVSKTCLVCPSGELAVPLMFCNTVTITVNSAVQAATHVAAAELSRDCAVAVLKCTVTAWRTPTV